MGYSAASQHEFKALYVPKDNIHETPRALVYHFFSIHVTSIRKNFILVHMMYSWTELTFPVVLPRLSLSSLLTLLLAVVIAMSLELRRVSLMLSVMAIFCPFWNSILLNCSNHCYILRVLVSQMEYFPYNFI